jgi:hypothetical protein
MVELVVGREAEGRFQPEGVVIRQGRSWITTTWDEDLDGPQFQRASPLVIGPRDIQTRRSRYWGR